MPSSKPAPVLTKPAMRCEAVAGLDNAAGFLNNECHFSSILALSASMSFSKAALRNLISSIDW